MEVTWYSSVDSPEECWFCYVNCSRQKVRYANLPASFSFPFYITGVCVLKFLSCLLLLHVYLLFFFSLALSLFFYKSKFLFRRKNIIEIQKIVFFSLYLNSYIISVNYSWKGNLNFIFELKHRCERKFLSWMNIRVQTFWRKFVGDVTVCIYAYR